MVREIAVVVEDGIYLGVALVGLNVIGFDRCSFRRRLLFWSNEIFMNFHELEVKLSFKYRRF